MTTPILKVNKTKPSRASHRQKAKEAFAAVLAIVGLTACGSADTTSTTTTVTAAPAATTTTPVGTCVAINSAQIPFTSTASYFDSSSIIMGTVPGYPAAVGAVTVGGTAVTGPYQREGSDGYLSINIQSTNQSMPHPLGYGLTGVSVTAQGYFAINQMVQQDILYKAQSGQIPELTGITDVSQICVSGMAMSMGHLEYLLHSGYLYLYLNNTTHGYIMYF